MNAEALTHAAKACRESADFLTRAADDADVLLHRVPDAGSGMRRASDDMRARAIGLKVAASFLVRCARYPEAAEILTALETGADVWVLPHEEPVVVCDEQDAPAPPLTLPQRLRALFPWRTPAKAA